MASRSTSQFPIMEGGDVEIWLTRKPEDRLLLHSFVLSLHSGWFKASLDERWANGVVDLPDATVKWMYILDFEDKQSASLSELPLPAPDDPNKEEDEPVDFYLNKNGSYPTRFFENQCEDRECIKVSDEEIPWKQAITWSYNMASKFVNQFPVFQDGDVEICLTRKPEDRFVLHSVVLSLHSAYFQASLDKRWSGGETQWRYELAFDDEGTGLLCRQASTRDNTTPDDSASMLFYQKDTKPCVDLPADEMSSRMEDVQSHKNYLRGLYSLPLTMTLDATDDHTVEGLEEFLALVRTADLYDSLKVLKPAVEGLLLFKLNGIRNGLDHVYVAMIEVASLFKMAWLFRDIVSRSIVRTSWDLSDLQVYSVDLADWIIEKREALKASLKTIDLELTTMELIPRGHSTWHDNVLLFVREMVIEVVRRRNRDGRLHDYAGIIPTIDSYVAGSEDDEELFAKIKKVVSGIIKPPYEHSPSGSHAEVLETADTDLRCIQILDEELPWNAAHSWHLD
ncbi:MAG: hypothetical protein Q9169_007494 [Polycauliona sp. 2 TL-2023]